MHIHNFNKKKNKWSTIYFWYEWFFIINKTIKFTYLYYLLLFNLIIEIKNRFILICIIFSYLLPDKGRSGKQKTGVVRRSGGSPVWGHTFIYKDVSLQELAERGLELTVWDHDRIASNEFLGGVRFNLGTGK